MEEKTSNIGWIVVAIVAIVAIVGLVLLFLSFSSKNLITGEILAIAPDRLAPEIFVPFTAQAAEIIEKVEAVGVEIRLVDWENCRVPIFREGQRVVFAMDCYQLLMQNNDDIIGERRGIPTAGELNLVCMGKCPMDDLCEIPVNIGKMPMYNAARACVESGGTIAHSSERVF